MYICRVLGREAAGSQKARICIIKQPTLSAGDWHIMAQSTINGSVSYTLNASYTLLAAGTQWVRVPEDRVLLPDGVLPSGEESRKAHPDQDRRRRFQIRPE